jgi:hypothetical protein
MHEIYKTEGSERESTQESPHPARGLAVQLPRVGLGAERAASVRITDTTSVSAGITSIGIVRQIQLLQIISNKS